ncbi:acylglycerol kinase, mitochondrial isoform X2 [Sturnira hondurensis]|uniref:acylglycerol kinase, mitochondrial isoform X2 n=1 Tax=Sturnira hondurensis TaxID=192404 RepID=UPI00187A766D|nr:acylglycerol kinase, mitochondrial isoform X2 [Sturnira hondurensis]
MTVFFKTLRSHWKKTTAGVCLLTWGSHWLYGKHCDNLLRRAACQEAQVFGNQLIPPNAQVKKATVFLNPAACKGKARTLFEKNAAPILHLSGMDVTVVKTDYEGQAKKLLELMENTDVIVVAGGDGTLQEVITGVLRRADEATFSKIPIGFIPLGQTSSLSPTLFAESGNKVQRITDATLAIVRGETVPLDVLQIKGEKEQPVFAVTGLRWGSFRDAGVKVSKYWYLGPLKTKAAHFFSTLQSTEDFMNICIEPDNVSKGDFISIGSKKVRDPKLRAEGTECFQASQCALLLPEGTGGSFGIDSEEYEAVPVEVKLLPRKLQFFWDPRRREQLTPHSAQ